MGLHSLDIRISTEFGQILDVPTLGFVITGLFDNKFNLSPTGIPTSKFVFLFSIDPVLFCFPVVDLTLITLGCSSPDGEIDSASCSFDDGPATPC